MTSIHQTEVVIELRAAEALADVIPLPTADTPSFYQRSGRTLPRLRNYRAIEYGRSSLPTPVKAEPETLVTRFKEFLRVNRPSWLPQR
jgi:hypothetical protein